MKTCAFAPRSNGPTRAFALSEDPRPPGFKKRPENRALLFNPKHQVFEEILEKSPGVPQLTPRAT